MKNTALTLLTGLGLATAAQAGSDYSSKGKEVIPPPAASCLWSWFAGGSAGVVDGDEWDEGIYTLHFGVERKCSDSSCSHAFYLEVGYTENDISKNALSGNDPNFNNDHTGPVTNIPGFESYDLEMSIIPITLNYKFECAVTGNLNWYVGAGAGVAIVDADLTHVESGDPEVNHDDSDVVFYGHIFAGLVYNFSESFELFGGVRYIIMDDANLGDGLDSHGVDNINIDGEIQYELGARFNF
ncbi:hypothetical protein NT6N_29010 [Oceaniferula spumae]|uniref:Outer membrane protein beta-barrel domain-containing protein n=1 Tax=Oceaniferula spumae TaxID=2979115 RepID=A0AAT9FPN8_9BACT